MNEEYCSGNRCICCGGFLVDAGSVRRLLDSLVEVHGRETVLRGLGVADSTLRSLLNGTRRWKWDHMENLFKMQQASNALRGGGE